MEHIFIVNPTAGQGKRQKSLVEELNSRGLSFYVTTEAGDGESYIKQFCEKNPGKPMRFYACGGDGTLNEVVNGIFEFENAEAACVPIGSGNDFVRNFGDPAAFRNLDRQLSGAAMPVDLIEYETEKHRRYVINMFNIGFDSNVVYKAAEVKKYPLVRDSFAYLLAVAIVLIRKEGADLDIVLCDGTSREGEILLTAVANGCFCGGGIKGVPLAEVDDGLIDVSIIKNVSRRTFASLFVKYKKGTHLEDPRGREIVQYMKCKNLMIRPRKGVLRFCADGEIEKTAEGIRFRNVQKAVRFSLPVRD